MKTRARKTATTTTRKDETTDSNATAKSAPKMSENMQTPPQVFVLPKNTSPHARFATIQHPGSGAPTRFFVCPERGFYELTRVAAPKKDNRSWLLASTQQQKEVVQTSTLQDEQEANGKEPHTSDKEESGYALQGADLLIATPLDPLFMILPALIGQGKILAQEYLASSDYITTLTQSSPQLRQIIESDPTNKLSKTLETRVAAICDVMDMGDEQLYCLSIPKLAAELVSKAKNMTQKGLPVSMEDRFIRQALEVPVLGIKREESGVSIASSDPEQTAESQDSITTTTTSSSFTSDASTAASSTDETTTTTSIANLLRLRVALNFLLNSYIPSRLHSALKTSFTDIKITSVDFTPLDQHLSKVASMKQQAQALRSLSDNISRKRSSAEDDEEMAVKKRKKEIEEEKKKNVSLGVKKLAKVNTSGMQKLSSFFAKKT